MNSEPLPPVVTRFLRYVRIDTTAEPESDAVPSSEGQLELGRMLVDEMRRAGITDVHQDEYGYVMGRIHASPGYEGPAIGLLAHIDTSPDAPGCGVEPIVHPPYDGGVLTFPGNPILHLDPAIQPALRKHLHHRLITSDGTTLLGSDDKAGVAIIMQLAEDLVRSEGARPDLRICFTVDEEIGKGVDHLNRERLGADIAYTIDGAGRDVLYCETFNAASITVTFRGRGVHPGYAQDKMINAVRVMARFIDRLPAAEAPETTADRDGFIHPHHITTAAVDHASLHLIVRDFDAAQLEERINLVRHLAGASASDFPGSEVDIQINHEYQNMREAIDRIDPRVRSFVHETADEMGLKLSEEPVRGGTDGARLASLGIPTPNIFNGGHDYHSLFEWNSVENLEHSLQFLRNLVAHWARRCSPSQNT